MTIVINIIDNNDNMTSKKIEVGDVFETRTGSKAEVVHYEGCAKVWVQFLDDVGYIRPFEARDLKRNGFKNPFQPNIYGKAYIGVGKYKSGTGSRSSGIAEAYKYWFQMIRRCYDEKYHERQPSYKGCSVYEPWLNYNVFAEWYYNQGYSGLGYHLDKDLLVKGNKLYSPETCCLLPRDINNLIMGKSVNSGEYPRRN